MKFNLPDFATKNCELKYDWHSWFAFIPVKVGNSFVFLEHVERRCNHSSWIKTYDQKSEWVWEYRFPKLNTNKSSISRHDI